MRRSILIDIIAFIFVVLFLYTGISKLIEYSVFKEQIAVSPVLTPFASLIVWLLPFTEIAVGVLLLVPKWRLIGFYIATSMMVVFTLYVAAILRFSENLPCSCGGILQQLNWNEHLVLNIVLTVVAVIGSLQEKIARRNLINEVSI